MDNRNYPRGVDVSAVVEQFWEVVANNELLAAYDTNVYLSPKDIVRAAAILGRPVRVLGGATTRTHPIPALCHEQAGYILQRMKCDTDLEIGAEFGVDEDAHHVHDVDARDEYRCHFKSDRSVQQMYSGVNCTRGGMKCNVKAKRLIFHGVHTSQENIVDMMYQHGSRTALMSMMLPDELLYGRHGYMTDDEKHYNIKIVRGNAHMTFADHSLAYIHPFDQWANWMRRSVISRKHGSYLVEITSKVGLVYILKITKVTTAVSAVIPLLTPNVTHYRVYDIATVLNKLFNAMSAMPRVGTENMRRSSLRKHLIKILHSADYVWVPKVAYDRCVDYGAARKDDSYNKTTMAVYWNAQRYELRVNGATIGDTGVNVDPEQSSWVRLTAFLHCAVIRYRETKAIGKIMTSFATFEEPSFWSKIKAWFMKKEDFMENDPMMQEFMAILSAVDVEGLLFRSSCSATGDLKVPPVSPVEIQFSHRGDCLQDCIHNTTNCTVPEWSGLTKQQYEAQRDNVLSSQPLFEYDDRHAWISTTTSNACIHGKARVLVADMRKRQAEFHDMVDAQSYWNATANTDCSRRHIQRLRDYLPKNWLSVATEAPGYWDAVNTETTTFDIVPGSPAEDMIGFGIDNFGEAKNLHCARCLKGLVGPVITSVPIFGGADAEIVANAVSIIAALKERNSPFTVYVPNISSIFSNCVPGSLDLAILIYGLKFFRPSRHDAGAWFSGGGGVLLGEKQWPFTLWSPLDGSCGKGIECLRQGKCIPMTPGPVVHVKNTQIHKVMPLLNGTFVTVPQSWNVDVLPAQDGGPVRLAPVVLRKRKKRPAPPVPENVEPRIPTAPPLDLMPPAVLPTAPPEDRTDRQLGVIHEVEEMVDVVEDMQPEEETEQLIDNQRDEQRETDVLDEQEESPILEEDGDISPGEEDIPAQIPRVVSPKDPTHYMCQQDIYYLGVCYRSALSLIVRDNEKTMAEATTIISNMPMDALVVATGVAVRLIYSNYGCHYEDAMFKGGILELDCGDEIGVWATMWKEVMENKHDRVDLPEYDGVCCGVYADLIAWGPLNPPERVELGKGKVTFDASQLMRAKAAFKSSIKPIEPYVTVHKKAIQRVIAMDFESGVYDIEGFEGTAGSGKTASMSEIVPPAHGVVVMVPYSSLSKAYKARGYTAYTQAAMLASGLEPKVLILDEAPAMHPFMIMWAVATVERVIWVGDMEQLSYNDGQQGKTMAGIPDFRELVKGEWPKKRVSYTVPLDMTRWTNSFTKQNNRTRNNLVNSLKIVKANIPHGANPTLVFTSNEKNFGIGSTVASQQGRRYTSLNMHHCGQTSGVMKVKGMAFVGFTRHSSVLTYWAGRLGVSKVPAVANCCYSPIDIGAVLGSRYEFSVDGRLWEHAGGEIVEGEKFKTSAVETETGKAIHVKTTVTPAYLQTQCLIAREIPWEEFPAEENEREMPERDNLYRSAPYQFVPLGVAEEIMQKIAPTNAPLFTENRLNIIKDLGEVDVDHTLTLNLATKPHVDQMPLKTNIAFSRVRCRSDRASDWARTNQCVVVRYASKSASRDEVLAQAKADRAFEGIMKFIDPSKVRKIDDKDLALATVSQVQRITAKSVPQDDVPPIFETDATVSFFSKQQQKVDLKEDGWIRRDDGDNLKAAQGVSALGKSYNHLAGPYVRAFSQVLAESLKEGFALGYGGSPRQLKDEVSKWDDGINVCCDITQMDCQRGLWSDIYLRRLWTMFGIPEAIIDVAIACHTDWTLRVIGMGTKLRVKDKYQSGCPWTLDSNTAVAMGMVGMSYDFKGMSGGLFQGDDSNIRCQSVAPTVYKDESLKCDVSEVGNFCGLTILGQRLFLDLPRLTAKLLNRAFADDGQVREYEVAVRDWLNLNHSAIDQIHNCQACALAYGITVDEAMQLMGFLWGFASGELVQSVKATGDAFAPGLIVTKQV